MSLRYVVENSRTFDNGHTIVTYWFGKHEGWGTTWGPITMTSIATFTSRDQAERSLRHVYGSMAEVKRRNIKIVRDPRRA